MCILRRYDKHEDGVGIYQKAWRMHQDCKWCNAFYSSHITDLNILLEWPHYLALLLQIILDLLDCIFASVKHARA
jgi:hypothetical protein